MRGLAECCTSPSSGARLYLALVGKMRNQGLNLALVLKLLRRRVRSIPPPRSTICREVYCIALFAVVSHAPMLVCCRTVLKGAPSNDTSLSLTTKHYLSLSPESSDKCSVIASKATRLRATTHPNVLDVILASPNLRFDVTARCNNQKVPESDLARSALVRELSRFMHRVGLATIWVHEPRFGTHYLVSVYLGNWSGSVWRPCVKSWCSQLHVHQSPLIDLSRTSDITPLET